MIEVIRACIAEHIDCDQLEVAGDAGRYDIRVVSEVFRELNRVKRQQVVYATIKHLITDGSVHAVTITTVTADAATDNSA